MSLETLIEAARYVEMQELKLKQATPPKQPVSVVAAPQQPITMTAPIRVKDALVAAAAPTATIQFHAAVPQQQMPAQHRAIRNSFDIINPLVIDEGGEAKRKPPPMVFRAGTREVHNKLEKHRRAHLKECFDALKKQLPATSDEKKTSNLNILHSALKCIHSLKKRELELEHEMERLAREKIEKQQKLAILKKDTSFQDFDFSTLQPDLSVMDTSSSLPEGTLLLKQEIKSEPSNDRPPATISNELKLTKSITRALPVVTTNSVNGIKETVVPQTTQVQTTALSVLPIGYPMNQGLVLQKVIVPKGIVSKGLSDFSQLVASPPVAHFIATPQQLGGKVVPLVNAQYVVKPLVVVSTPSRPS